MDETYELWIGSTLYGEYKSLFETQEAEEALDWSQLAEEVKEEGTYIVEK